MKRYLLVFVLAAACLGLFAAPASAFYAPQQHTAYIPYWIQGEGGGWLEWAGTGPYDIIDHTGVNNVPIPHDYKVVVTAEWFDTRLGATLIPAEWFHTMAISRSTGCWSFAITRAACGLRYWSPAYKWDPAAPDDQTWARDWWVPLGKLRPGHYSGWVRESVPRAFPTWTDPATGEFLPLNSPYMVQADDFTLPISFSVQ